MNSYSVEGYSALTKKSGLVDFSSRGKIRVTGNDRVTVLHRLLTQNIRALSPGMKKPSAFLNARGKVLSLMHVWVFEDFILLDTEAGFQNSLIDSLNRLIITEDVSLKEETVWGHFLLTGPSAAANVQALFPEITFEADGIFKKTGFSNGRPEIFAARNTASEFEFILPENPDNFRKHLFEKTTNLPEVNEESFEVFRIERGLLRYGKDVTDEVTLPETGLDALFASDSKGCYPGQEVVARTNTYKGHAKKMRGLILKASEIPSPGSILSFEGNEIGRITSACYSPALQMPAALAYLNRGFFEVPGEKVLEVAGKNISAKITELPLVNS